MSFTIDGVRPSFDRISRRIRQSCIRFSLQREETKTVVLRFSSRWIRYQRIGLFVSISRDVSTRTWPISKRSTLVEKYRNGYCWIASRNNKKIRDIVVEKKKPCREYQPVTRKGNLRNREPLKCCKCNEQPDFTSLRCLIAKRFVGIENVSTAFDEKSIDRILFRRKDETTVFQDKRCKRRI